MSISRQDYIALLFYYMGYSKVRNIIHCFQNKTVARFVAFHDILPETSSVFRKNLLFLQKNTNVISLEDFVLGKLCSKKINVVITFDDGYKSWISEAVPNLKKLGLPATFFISSGFIGLSKKDEEEFIKSKLFRKLGPRRMTGSLTYDDVRKIVKNGFTVGGHTLNHCDLEKLQDISRLRYEIAEDKIRIEKITGQKVDFFAYPSGAYKNSVIDITKILVEIGYKAAVTTVSGFNSAESNLYLLHRELTRASMDWRVFKARVYGNSDVSQILKNKMRLTLRP
jgi:peptidoglycan/xylan/chitin deacetylase (PgdA/CDA1 family)